MYSPYPTAGGERAGFWARLGGFVLDSLVGALIGLPFFIASIFFFRDAYEDCYSIDDEIFCPAGSPEGGPLAIAIILVTIGGLVGLAMLIRWQGKGASPGMKAAGIRLLDARTLQPVGAGRATGRYFASILSALPCYLGFLWMLWDSERQTWHDKMVNTVVVKG